MVEEIKKNPIAQLYFMQPPNPNDLHYSELMEEFIDLNLIENNLKLGVYFGTFSFI